MEGLSLHNGAALRCFWNSTAGWEPLEDDCQMSEDYRDFFTLAAEEAARYRRALADGPIRPKRDYAATFAAFKEPLPEASQPGAEVLAELVLKAEPGLMGMASPRFFGWVLGASHPVSVAADWLASAWGQNTGMHTPTPSASAIEEVVAGWLLEILDLPRESSVGFVTGATMGNFVGLCAARGEVLRRAGWDSDADGLFGAPEIHVFIGDDAHTSLFSALQYCGLGHRRVIRISTDDQGRMIADHLKEEIKTRGGPKIVVTQAGQINTGAFDPVGEIAEIAHSHGAWVHVDAAFGLWARAAPQRAHLAAGVEKADSWVTDGHKWLQLPFDSGFVFIRNADAHLRAMATTASYLPARESGDRVPSSLVPELSRRARGFAAWAMLKTLGREGVAELVERHCTLASQMAGRPRGGTGYPRVERRGPQSGRRRIRSAVRCGCLPPSHRSGHRPGAGR